MSMLSRNLRYFREQRNMPQMELSEMTGVKQSDISAFESGHKSPRVDTAIAIADALGVSVSQLIGSED